MGMKIKKAKIKDLDVVIKMKMEMFIVTLWKTR